ncbi:MULTISPECIES: flavodoxin domain-containing protein [Clostridium]|uniref:flavodoxin domain-containing protein n=1 Tax=Clostridium TaxID=1485 RepID=UPI001E30A394|nr:flavodoxin domain-containing protein [[Clostridium] innocuum]MCQ5278151.1 flavodoxin domain-containing protein [Clostridium sp. DFI.1.208]MCC2845473.1 flavodoxin domain-containing protein [[Clostridium] innocuum]MCC2849660.1 flavodoxin domain-containing protein [[Clostridium] innocuum]MCC2853618.1 flavodoxin domain-containing protein [[Clostridium] innocuum]MCG4662281.1 flavodoxin domain-containing protein [[Clostridium] innocuum]
MHGNSSVYATACMLQENGEYMKTLIIYKSKHGAGKEVAQYVQQKLSADLREADSALSWEGYERIVCVGSIYAGRLAKQLIACIHANTQELAREKRLYAAVRYERCCTGKNHYRESGRGVLSTACLFCAYRRQTGFS